jgi:CheY-like chemotaxis protein
MPKLMLVEDDNNLREIYEARLQAEGYDIVTARDGEEALVVAKAQQPDLIVSDVMMPKISGFEMLDILRNTDGLKDVKVIMLTALGQSDDQQRADRLGADRYLVKSQVTLEDIVKVTHELLGDAPAEAAPAAATPAEAPAAAATPAAAPAPAVVPEPVAVEPEPAVVAEPPVAVVESSAPAEPAAATPAPAPAAPAVDNNGSAVSTAQEEAEVEARIEDFVAGATDVAPAPTPAVPAAAEPVVAPAEPVTPAPAVEPVAPPEPAADDAKADDSLLADAVKTLGGDDADSSPAPTPAAPAAPAIIRQPTPAAADSEPSTAPAVVGSQRVITPIESSEPKKDLDALLAIENAKEGTPPAATPVAPATVITSATPTAEPASTTPPATVVTPAQPATPTPPPAADGDTPAVDPNSIAL